MADQVYTKKFDDGRTRERVASTPRDHVQLQFEGWVPKGEKANPAVPGEAPKSDKSSK